MRLIAHAQPSIVSGPNAFRVDREIPPAREKLRLFAQQVEIEAIGVLGAFQRSAARTLRIRSVRHHRAGPHGSATATEQHHQPARIDSPAYCLAAAHATHDTNEQHSRPHQPDGLATASVVPRSRPTHQHPQPSRLRPARTALIANQSRARSEVDTTDLRTSARPSQNGASVVRLCPQQGSDWRGRNRPVLEQLSPSHLPQINIRQRVGGRRTSRTSKGRSG